MAVQLQMHEQGSDSRAVVSKADANAPQDAPNK